MAILALSIFLVVFGPTFGEFWTQPSFPFNRSGPYGAYGDFVFDQAIESIQFETLALLMAMMLLVEVAREAGIFLG